MDQLERLIVKARSGDVAYVPLSPLDIYLGHFVTGLIYFFLKSPDIRRLKEALAHALDRHPSFGASMVREANSIGLSCGAGVELSIYRSNAPCPDLRSTESLASIALSIELSIELSIDDMARSSTDPRRDAGNAIGTSERRDNDDVRHVTGNYPFNQGLPIARFYLVLFNGEACALIARYVHSHGDGMTLINFLADWSTIYREETLAPLSGYPRSAISGLADSSVTQPSGKLNVVQNTFDPGKPAANTPNQSTVAQRQGGAIRIDIALSTLQNFIHQCRLRSTLALSSSDIIHALSWKCFALSHTARSHAAQETLSHGALSQEPLFHETENEGNIRLYTLFDLRGIAALGIPRDYEGSAILGRWAEATHADLLNLSVADIANTFRRQTKPIDVNDIYRDIGYLAHEYTAGHIDANGNFSRFTIGAWLDCRSARGLIVNDLRRLGETKICFEERAARMETLVSDEINIVSVYQNDDGTATLHYVGELSTLAAFAKHLKNILETGST